MFGWGKKEDAEVGLWFNTDTEGEYQYGFGDTPWGRVGSRENAQKLLDLTDEEMAALDKYGEIEKDVNGATITIEAGWGWG